LAKNKRQLIGIVIAEIPN